MLPSHYTRLLLSGSTLPDLLRRYVDWVIGSGSSARYRTGRIRIGVHPSWTSSRIEEGGRFQGLHDCNVTVRVSNTRFVVWFSHRGEDDASTIWHNVVRTRQADNDLVLEHGVGRSTAPGVTLTPIAAPPSILTSICADRTLTIRPRDFFHNTALSLARGRVGDFVRFFLRDDARTLPIVLISPRSPEEGPLASPAILARSLYTLALTAVLDDHRCAYELTDALRNAGLDKQYSCYDGAVRLYRPGLGARAGDDSFRHYLWLPTRIETIPEEHRDRILAGEIARAIVRESIPRDFFFSIEDFDRTELEERRANLQEVAAAAPPVAELDLGQLATRLDEERLQREQAQELLDVAVAAEGDLRCKFEHLQQELAEERTARERAEQERDAHNARERRLRDELERSKKAKAGSRALAELADLPGTLLEVIDLFLSAHSDQIAFTDRGRSSACNCTDVEPRLAWRCLKQMADSLHPLLFRDKNTGVDIEVTFRSKSGFTLAMTEGKQTKKDHAVMRTRQDMFGGTTIDATPHVKLDKDSNRFYFARFEDAERKLIVISFVGHLDTAGTRRRGK